MNADDLHVLAGEYVLGTLPAARRAEVEARMGNDAALHGGGAVATETPAINALAAPVEPSPALWSRIENIRCRTGGSGTKAPCGGDAHRSGGVAGGTVCACGVFLRDWFRRPPPSWASWWSAKLAQPPGPRLHGWSWSDCRDKSPGWVVQAGTNSQQARLIPPRQGGRACRQVAAVLDQKGNDWKARLAGSGAPRRIERSVADKLPPLEPNQLFEITLEPYNGSPPIVPPARFCSSGGR